MIDIKTLLNDVNVFKKHSDIKSGASLINPIGTAGKLFFLEIFPGASQTEVELLKKNYRGVLPNEYSDFLKVTNGANILGRYLKIAGIPYDPLKYNGCKIPDPIQFVDGHRTFGTPPKWFFFATYSDWQNIGMAHVCLDCSVSGDKKPVYCLPYDGNEILKQWDSFDEWFSQEFSRLYQIYLNHEYKLIDIVPGMVQRIQVFSS